MDILEVETSDGVKLPIPPPLPPCPMPTQTPTNWLSMTETCSWAMALVHKFKYEPPAHKTVDSLLSKNYERNKSEYVWASSWWPKRLNHSVWIIWIYLKPEGNPCKNDDVAIGCNQANAISNDLMHRGWWWSALASSHLFSMCVPILKFHFQIYFGLFEGLR